MVFDFDGRLSDSPWVEGIWRTRSEQSGSFMSSAATHWEMVITRQYGQTTLTVRGPETYASCVEIPEEAEFFGIIFKMGTFMPLLPVAHLVDGSINLPEATGQSFWLQGATWQLPTFENADTFIHRLVQQELLVYDPLIEAVLQNHEPDVSARTIRRRFLKATGITPKLVEQIQRARQAATLLEQGYPILDTVYEAGYFDQAHMTKSLKRFLGQTPSQLDYVPPMLSAVTPNTEK